MIKTLPPAIIRMDQSTQSRVSIDEETVKSYAQDLKDGADFPPITVFFDDTEYWLADGFHRLEAMIQIGRDAIEADAREGTQRDAILFAVGANATNGLRRTNADKRRAVELLLNDKEWSSWSDRQIADKCGVAPNTVKSHRENLSAQNAQIRHPEKRTVTRKGRIYTQKIAKIGKRDPSPNKPAPVKSGDAPRKGDGPSYLFYQAKTFLKEIDPADPEGAKLMKKLRDWIDERLGTEKESDDA
jgi:hypothetical protein